MGFSMKCSPSSHIDGTPHATQLDVPWPGHGAAQRTAAQSGGADWGCSGA